jgi:hypothetical protein
MKHIWIALLALVLCVSPVWAQATLRVQNTGASAAATVTTTLTGVVAGDFLAVCIYERDGNAISSVSDDVNGAWTLAEQRAVTAAQTALYYKANSGAGAPVVTVTIGGTTPRDINAQAWSGMPTSATPDTSAEAGNSSVTAHTHGSITPSAASLVLTCLGTGANHGGVSAYHSGFTGLNVDAGVTDANRRAYAYKVTHTGAVDPTHTTVNSVNSDGIAVAFAQSAGGGGSTRQLLMLGVGPEQ